MPAAAWRSIQPQRTRRPREPARGPDAASRRRRARTAIPAARIRQGERRGMLVLLASILGLGVLGAGMIALAPGPVAP
jgi:hypothetical protein